MKEQLITFDTAKLAREKGFKSKSKSICNIVWMQDCDYQSGEPYEPNIWLNGNEFETDLDLDKFKEIFKTDKFKVTDLLIPTQSLLQKWLREVHEISIKIDDFITNTKIRFDYSVSNLGSQDDNPQGIFETYEEALEMGLQEALKLI